MLLCVFGGASAREGEKGQTRDAETKVQGETGPTGRLRQAETERKSRDLAV